MHATKQKEELMKNTPKRTFEFLDAFYADTTIASVETNSHYLGFIIKDVDTKKIYVIDSVNCRDFCFKSNEFFKQTSSNGLQPLNFGDKGYFWMEDIAKMKPVEKIREGNLIKVGYKGNLVKYEYKGCFANPELKEAKWRMEKEPFLLYNFNPKYDLSLFEQAQHIYGVATFEQ
jgi:hypothetical protein